MRSIILILALISILFGQNHQLINRIEMSETSFKKIDNIKIQFIVENVGLSEASFCTRYTPFESLAGNIFNVTMNGSKVDYIGRFVKRGRITENEYIVLKPGEIRSIEFNLEEGYDIYKKGIYKISYKSQKSSNKVTSYKGKKNFQLRSSNEKEFELSEKRLSKVKIESFNNEKYKNFKTPTTPACNNCSADEISYINTAYTSAIDLVNTAKRSLEQTPNSSRTYSATRYIQWFGDHDFSRYRIVANHMQEILRTLRDEPVAFTKMSPNDPYIDAYAYVYPYNPYTIYLGNAFWSAANTGTDSRAGTIIHELSHFNIVCGTDDFVYGQSACITLADNIPANAIDNADSHEYFCENTPALVMPVDNRFLSDFNDDGRTDLLFFEPWNNSIHVNISKDTGFFGTGTGQWINPNGFGSLKDNYFPGDYNGDGITDLGYLEGNNSFHVSISTGTGFVGSGSGCWIGPNEWVSTSGEYYTGDFNGDGKTDLLFFNSSNNSIQVTLSTGTTFNARHSGQWIGPNGFGSLKDNYFPGDYDGDGLTDLGYLEGNNSFHVSISTGTGFNGSGSGCWVQPNGFGGTYGSHYVGFFNNDSCADLMFFEPGNNSIHVSTSTGTGFSGSGSGRWIGPNGFGSLKNNYFPADFNSDGLTDLGYLEGNNSFHVVISTGTSFVLPSNGTAPWISSNTWGGSWGKYYVGQCLNRK